MVEQPYLEKITVDLVYNPKYGRDRVCRCGHKYYRHFDTYDHMENTGCKYCECREFDWSPAAHVADQPGPPELVMLAEARQALGLSEVAAPESPGALWRETLADMTALRGALRVALEEKATLQRGWIERRDEMIRIHDAQMGVVHAMILVDEAKLATLRIDRDALADDVKRLRILRSDEAQESQRARQGGAAGVGDAALTPGADSR